MEGTAILWVMLNGEGVVTSTRVVTSSGHDGLDEAAARALRESAFSPAKLEGEPVTVWIQMPISFRLR